MPKKGAILRAEELVKFLKSIKFVKYENMAIERFEDIIVWQKSREFAKVVYTTFQSCKDYAFRDQIQRAVISIGNNIAEGYERRSNKELKNFLFISKGSCGEVRSMLYAAADLKYINQEAFTKLSGAALEISKMLSGFIKKL